MPTDAPLIVLIILVALVFDFLNGFHDAANSIATVVSTRVLSPQKAVVWAAFFNFVAAFVLGTHVAKTMGSGMIDLSVVTRDVVLAGLVGAIAWNLITWYYGIPVSLLARAHRRLRGRGDREGGLGRHHRVRLDEDPAVHRARAPHRDGPRLHAHGLDHVALAEVEPLRLDKLFRRLQLLSAAVYSLGHGGNDAQKTMGIITGLLVASGHLQKFEVPLWVILISHAAIAFGTMFGGWRIVKTMGSKITKLQPFGGFCAETAGALTLIGATLSGIPVSTTHTITGAIVGVGATRRLSAVKWGVAGRIVWAWVLTIPLAAAMSAATYFLVRRLL